MIDYSRFRLSFNAAVAIVRKVAGEHSARPPIYYNSAEAKVWRAAWDACTRDFTASLMDELRKEAIRQEEDTPDPPRSKVDPTKQVIVYTGGHTPTSPLNIVPPKKAP